MKKVVILALIISLVAGAVFAEVNASAWAAGRAYTIIGDNVENSHPLAFGARDLRFWAQGQNEDGTFGALIRFWERGSNVLSPNAVTVNPDDIDITADSLSFPVNNDTHGWVWWKPIDQVRLQLGRNTFGDFAVWEVVRGSSFYGAARDGGQGSLLRIGSGYASTHQTQQLDTAFVGQTFTEGGAELSIYPIEGLSINFGIPYEFGSGGKANHVYKNMLAQVQYKIENVGRLSFAFRGNDTAELKNAANPANANHALYLGFFLNGIENLEANLGLRFMLPYELDGADVTVNYPFLIALGAAYTAGDFGIKARAEFGLGSSVKGTTTVNRETTIYFEILPSYDVGICKIFLSAALDVAAYNDDAYLNPVTGKKDAKVGFSLNPYITKTVGPGNFFAGFRFWADGTKVKPADTSSASKVMFDIPIGLVVSF